MNIMIKIIFYVLYAIIIIYSSFHMTVSFKEDTDGPSIHRKKARIGIVIWIAAIIVKSVLEAYLEQG